MGAEAADLSRCAEDELLGRVAEGDEAAFGELFRRYAAQLRAFALQWMPPALRRKVSASDILQEANLVALRRLGTFEHRGEGSLRRWLMRIVRYKTREALRAHAGTARRRLDREITRDRRPDTGQIRGHDPTPSQVAIAHETQERALAALARLPPHYRQVFHMARREGLTLREIGERTGRSRESTKKLYARALARFTAEYRSLGGREGSAP